MIRTLAVTVVLTVALGGAVTTYGTETSIQQLIPADATLVAFARDVPGIIERWSETPFRRLWNDPQVTKFFAPLRARLEDEGFSEALDEETAAELDEILSLLTGDAVLFLPRLEEALAEQEEEFAPAVVIAAVGDNGPELARRIEGTDLSGIELEEGTVWVTREFSGVELHVARELSEDGPRDQFSWAVFDGLFALTSTPSLLERLVSDARKGGTAQPLTTSPSYDTISRFALSSDVSLFLDLERIMPVVQSTLREQFDPSQSPMIPIEPDALYDALGLETLRAAFAGVSIGAEGLVGDMAVTFAGNRGLIKLLAYGPGEAPRPGLIPANATTFGSARFDFTTAWEAVEEIVNGVNPTLLAMAGAQVSAMIQNAEVELDLRRDLLENLGDEIIMVQGDPAGGTAHDDTQPMIQPSQVIGVSIRQRQSFELALETLKTMAGQGSDLFEEREFLGTTIYSLDLPQATGSIAYAITDEYFLISFGSTSVLESILVAKGERGRSAWRTPQVERTLSLLPPGASAVNYQDLAATGHTMFQALAQLATLDPGGELALCDPTEVPNAEVIGAYLGSAVSGLYRDSSSLVVRLRVLPPAGSPE
jgi:hypothetical protein